MPPQHAKHNGCACLKSPDRRSVKLELEKEWLGKLNGVLSTHQFEAHLELQQQRKILAATIFLKRKAPVTAQVTGTAAPTTPATATTTTTTAP